jgi:hypothetical protein
VRLGSDLYRALGRLVARSFGSLDGVLGVYARRSVAAGEVAIGRSDLDLHLLVAEPASVEAEVELLLRLADRLRLLRRTVRVVGPIYASTRAELERWYTEQPAHWYRDRAWLRLWGEEFERPRTELEGARRDELLWLYFWSCELLVRDFRAGHARGCWNAFLDMFDAYRLYAGLSGEPLTREELAELWCASSPPDRGRTAILRAHRRRFRGRDGHALQPLFRESLILHDVLCREVPDAVEGAASGELESLAPPGFLPRRYLVVDPAAPAEVDAAAAAVHRNETVWPLTRAALNTYLSHRNPWEHAPLVARNPGVQLGAPSAEAFRRSISIALYPEVPRLFGFVGNHWLAGDLYAERRLYATDGLVFASPGELADAYLERFGVSPRTDGTQVEYFRTHYPRLREVIDEIRGRLAR